MNIISFINHCPNPFGSYESPSTYLPLNKEHLLFQNLEVPSYKNKNKVLQKIATKKSQVFILLDPVY
ncbi:hypothetical protein P3L10_025748 [Capsicum annuum]